MAQGSSSFDGACVAKRPVMELTQAYLKSILHYAPETGVFTRLKRPQGTHPCSDIVNIPSKSTGYIYIRLLGHVYSLHRLAFLYMNGRFPKKRVDHRDQIKTNNAWSNLREASRTQNAWNSKLRTTNSSGVPGVHWYVPGRKWRVALRYNGKKNHIGLYKTLEEARCVAEQTRRKHHGEFYSPISL